MLKINPLVLFCCISLLLLTLDVRASEKVIDGPAADIQEPTLDPSDYQSEFVAVPFIFSTETLSTTVGGAGVLKHAGQVQASLLGIGLYSKNDSWVTFLGANNYQLPTLDNWLFSAEYYRGSYKQGIYYIADGAAAVANGPSYQQAERVVTQGEESYTKLRMKYVLPWGRGAGGAIASLMPNQGEVEWNPLNSGVTSIELTPFTETQELQGYEHLPSESRGLQLKLDWDNRDNGKNSTRGGRTSLTFSRDFGSDDRQSWTTWEFEQSAFLGLGESEWFNNHIIALDFYIADTPTWDSKSDDGYHRPPSFSGITLGGFNYLRGYNGNRFFGRSAVLYRGEYRMLPKWQPLQTLPVFNLYDIPWWQWALFAEAGQVADEFAMDELHKDLKWTLGAGIRFEVESVVVRTELAVGEEGNQFWVMVNQPF
ncbi:hypothetical protein FLM48_18685 [Shewanella sp. Scap07]|uniref:hypothetical protein n=1 Tax=Shewanella sp. Scap07 TaxID=2589987 RepID=UPI0015C0212E|nr:hypothetical protein [Shewanella sp. Scap07]QLE86913.1 hypothetical protein FLM48_18685 [Shewanella sp. Scap07]